MRAQRAGEVGTLRTFAVALSIVVGLAKAAVAADCGQAFDDARAPPADAATVPLSCSRDPASARHCVALDDPAQGFDAGAAPAAYRLWLRLATGARSTTIRIGLDDRPQQPWFAPPTPSGWQLVTEADGRTARRFDLAGTHRLRITPRHDARASADCALFVRDPDFVPDMAALHRIDRAWSGTNALFDAVADRGHLYVGYYAADRRLTVAAFDRATRRWSRQTLPTVFDGWDGHNAIALALDGEGQLHVAGNMHASPLVYARTRAPARIDTLDRLRPMVGSDETRATYPMFFDDGGALIFIYRSGVSGNGRTLVNRYADGAWHRLLAAPLFADRSGTGSVNAYPTDPVRGADGFWHLAWVWRASADGAATFQVAYGRSRDLVHWEDADGHAATLPIRPGDGIIDDVPQAGGLANGITLGFDHAGRPIVSYLKFDAQGHSQLYNARRRDGGWQIVQASNWSDRWMIEGHGSVVALIHPEAVRAAADGTLRQGVRHWRAGLVELVLDEATLRPLREAPYRRALPAALLRPTIEGAEFTTIAIPARMIDGAARPFILRWEAEYGHRDQRPDCTPATPVACDPPPSDLVVYEPRP